MTRTILLTAAILACLAGGAAAQSSLPPKATPGARNPAVTQMTIASTICVPGWAHAIRPPSGYTTAVKRRQIAAAGLPGGMRAYEEDHLIPLELGGSADSSLNLWPEPRHSADGWTASQKDRLEDVLHRLVCSLLLPLPEAQAAIAADWHAAFRAHVAPRR